MSKGGRDIVQTSANFPFAINPGGSTGPSTGAPAIRQIIPSWANTSSIQFVMPMATLANSILVIGTGSAGGQGNPSATDNRNNTAWTLGTINGGNAGFPGLSVGTLWTKPATILQANDTVTVSSNVAIGDMGAVLYELTGIGSSPYPGMNGNSVSLNPGTQIPFTNSSILPKVCVIVLGLNAPPPTLTGATLDNPSANASSKIQIAHVAAPTGQGTVSGKWTFSSTQANLSAQEYHA